MIIDVPAPARPWARSLVALVLMCAGVPSCGGVPAEEVGGEIGAAFLTRIRQGQVEQAWQGTTAEFKSMLGLEGLRAYVAAHPELSGPAQFEGQEALDREGLDLAKCRYRATPGGQPITVLLAREGGEWKVERLGTD